MKWKFNSYVGFRIENFSSFKAKRLRDVVTTLMEFPLRIGGEFLKLSRDTLKYIFTIKQNGKSTKRCHCEIISFFTCPFYKTAVLKNKTRFDEIRKKISLGNTYNIM